MVLNFAPLYQLCPALTRIAAICYEYAMIKLLSAQVVGLDAKPIDIEVDISPGLHIFSIVGLADKEIQESRERVGSAIRHIGARPPHKKSQRVIINLSPADLKKEGPAFDLPIALGFLLSSEQARFDPAEKMFVGELGLDGAIKKVSGVLPITILARALGVRELYIPKGNGEEASLVDGVTIFETASLSELLDVLEGRTVYEPVRPHATMRAENTPAETDFSHIRGQETAKRAALIAAAGNHNMFMEGPPGTGKTLLAKTLATILPAMADEEVIEVTKIYSVAGELKEKGRPVTSRPFRAPHHSASPVSITGGGSTIRPGEITMAHRGVLFLDELPEFQRSVLEALRQPLENREITVARAQGAATFPADFMLVAAMNPCPCGNYGNTKKECVCAPGAISKYRRKISGPLLDRIDLCINVPNVEYEKLEEPATTGETSADIRARVEAARTVQRTRFSGERIQTNSQMSTALIKKYCPLSESSKVLLETAYNQYGFSPRAYFRIIKVARTIADLAGARAIEDPHVLEALQYRPKAEV